jgi:Mor family transcriptional regulator
MTRNKDPRSKRATAFVEAATRIFVQRLTTDLEIEKETALAISRDSIHELCSELGPDLVYIPKGLEFEVTEKHKAIYKDFDGRNMHEVVAKHKVSPQWVYSICARIRKAELADRQGKLPGFDAENKN